ncbi:hypothetical protein [Pseudarthrobacter sp. PS3-L1]|uniref:hypothetical protein n=1 Tax=Pseudarthrobacter sp. PS3-L1 TaxID=3046207 RepID=UPI0024B98657|nr:hypothetical protein [Pseudarthrobacter sp. PS3-L1]MDJ0320443.1 hypothetical protein [Pseudarthrobacter sp. PS3-L1]
MADCERGLGRPDRALDVARSEEANDLDAPGKVELAIVAAGARTDLGQLDAAVSELEISQLDMHKAFSYSPRLFRAYADVLAAVDRTTEAAMWEKQADKAEKALGIDQNDDEPEIFDLGWDEEEEAREEADRRRMLSETATAATSVPAMREEPAPAALADLGDDADATTFESDDAESDDDSVEHDELAHARDHADQAEAPADESSDERHDETQGDLDDAGRQG